MLEIREANRYSIDSYENAYAAGLKYLVVFDDTIIAGFALSEDAIKFANNAITEEKVNGTYSGL